MTANSNVRNNHSVILVYDNECPICSRFATLLRIKKSIGSLELINARDNHPVVKQINLRGFNLDLGFALKLGDEFYVGADAMHILALISSKSGTLNRILYFVFRSKIRSKFLYPQLRTCRNLLLRLLGKQKINH